MTSDRSGDRAGAGLAGVDPALRDEIEALIEARVEAAVEARLGSALDTKISGQIDAQLVQRVHTLEGLISDARARLEAVEAERGLDQVSILVFSGDMDRMISAFIIATGAIAMGCEVSMYFTFWGLTGIKKKTVYSDKSLPERMLAAMLPGGASSLGTSRMNMLGMGPALFRSLMRKHNVESLPDLIGLAREMGVKMVACQMAMGVMGIRQEELIDELEYGGVVTYLGDALDSKVTLFI